MNSFSVPDGITGNTLSNMAVDDRMVTEPDALQTPLNIQVGMSLEAAEKFLIEATLQHTHGNMSAAARILGIDRGTLYKRVEKYRL